MAPVVAKSLSRLSRDSLIDLCLKWTDSENSTPYLASNRDAIECDEEDYLHTPAEDIASLRKRFLDLKQGDITGRDAVAKKDIVDRIVDGDWRRGLSLQQLADIDFANLEQNDMALRWSALKLVPLSETASEDLSCSHPAKKRKISHRQQPHYPTISPANFVANLKSHISPLVKAHYSIHRLPAPSKLAVLRLYLVPNTPFAPLSSNVPRNVRQATDLGRVMYIALPDSCPYIYISLSGNAGSKLTQGGKDTAQIGKMDVAATKRVVLESIPKALSKPQERWSLENTKLTCRSLKAIGLLRGNSRPGTAGGSYSKFSEEYEWKPSGKSFSKGQDTNARNQHSAATETTPLTISRPVPSIPQPTSHESQITARFGTMSSPSHAKLDRFHVTINNLLAPPPTRKSQPPRKSKRKRRSLEDIEAGRDGPVEELQPTSQTTQDSSTESAQISLTFSGMDVFRGLRELALMDGGKYVDLERLPAWGTGEKGVSGLTV